MYNVYTLYIMSTVQCKLYSGLLIGLFRERERDRERQRERERERERKNGCVCNLYI